MSLRLQKLSEPSHCSVFAALHGIPLPLNLRTTSNKTRVLHAGKVLIVEHHSVLLQGLPCVLFQLSRIRFIDLRGLDLNGHCSFVDVVLREQAWMSGYDAIHQTIELSRGQTEANPASIAIPYGADFAVFAAEFAGASEDLRLPDVSRVATDEAVEVNLVECCSFQSVVRKLLAVETDQMSSDLLPCDEHGERDSQLTNPARKL